MHVPALLQSTVMCSCTATTQGCGSLFTMPSAVSPQAGSHNGASFSTSAHAANSSSSSDSRSHSNSASSSSASGPTIAVASSSPQYAPEDSYDVIVVGAGHAGRLVLLRCLQRIRESSPPSLQLQHILVASRCSSVTAVVASHPTPPCPTNTTSPALPHPSSPLRSLPHHVMLRLRSSACIGPHGLQNPAADPQSGPHRLAALQPSSGWACQEPAGARG